MSPPYLFTIKGSSDPQEVGTTSRHCPHAFDTIGTTYYTAWPTFKRPNQQPFQAYKLTIHLDHKDRSR